MSFDRLLGQRGHACGNVSINRNVGNAYFLHRRNLRARLASMPIEETFALEGGDVLHNRGLTGEAEMTLDLARARRDSLFPLLALDKIENVFLTIGQHPTMIGEGDQCSSSNEQMRPWSDREALATGAMCDRVRVRAFEPALLPVAAIIEHRTADEECALWIDHQTHIGGRDKNVALFGAVHQIHGVLQTGAPAANYGETQRAVGISFLIQ